MNAMLFAASLLSQEVQEARKPTHTIQPLILNRWSPRSMTGEALTSEELLPLFEAARWAPSSANKQPWRFLYAKRDTPEWDLYYNLLVDFNKEWCKKAAALLVIISNNAHSTHSYDTGAAWMSLALEGSSRGLVVHGIGGFDANQARKTLNIPENYSIEAMAAIGKRAPKGQLPKHLQEREMPSSRKAIEEVATAGKFTP